MKKLTSAVLATFLVAGLQFTGFAGDNVNATGNDNDPLKHPVNAYNNHEVKEDMKDSTVNSQKAEESKKAYKEAKDNYEKSMKENGADSEVTKEAKNRMEEAHKDWAKYEKKTNKANKELRHDQIKAHQ